MGNSNSSQSITPLSAASIMKVKSYTFGEASTDVINNIDTVVDETIVFLKAMLDHVLTPIFNGDFEEKPKTVQIIKYLLGLRLIIKQKDTKAGEPIIKGKYRFVSTMYKDKSSQNTNNIGSTYISLITQYIILLENSKTVTNDKVLSIEGIDNDSDNDKYISNMKTKINTKLAKMNNYIKFFTFDSYIVDYSRYVYMIYAIQIFKDVDDIHNFLKLKNDLATLDKHIEIRSLDSMETQMGKEIGNLTELMRNEANTDVKKIIDIPTTTPQTGFVNAQVSKINTQQGGSNVQVTINNLKQAFESREQQFNADREALVVFFNTVNDIIKTASEEIKEVYFRKYENILTDKQIVDTLNDISTRLLSTNTDNGIDQAFAEIFTAEEKTVLENKLSRYITGKKVKSKDITNLVTLFDKINKLNQHTKTNLVPTLIPKPVI